MSRDTVRYVDGLGWVWVDECRKPDGRRILTAWEQSNGPHVPHGLAHHTVSDSGPEEGPTNIVWGRIDSRNLPQWIDAIPSLSIQRESAVRSWRASQRHLALCLIRAIRPDSVSGVSDPECGEVILPPDPPQAV